MSYGYVYVAQIAMGADKNQCLKAFAEAEAYNGPSIIIAMRPVSTTALRAAWAFQVEEEKAVKAGYRHLFPLQPALADEGKNPFSLDSKAPSASYRDFIMNEVRYNSLTRAFPERAEKLFAEAEKAATEKYEHLVRLSALYAPKDAE